MDIFHLLKIPIDTSKEAIKLLYYKKLRECHPHGSSRGDPVFFMAITEAYKRFLLGDDFVNCFMVCHPDTADFSCRCGGMYAIPKGYLGRIECNFCSCFIVVEDAPYSLPPGS